MITVEREHGEIYGVVAGRVAASFCLCALPWGHGWVCESWACSEVRSIDGSVACACCSGQEGRQVGLSLI